jgi:hypothetical protein
MATAIAGVLANKAYNILAKNRNVIIPLDDISNTRVMTDTQIKKEFCPQTMPTGKKRKTNLEKVLERS